MVYLSHWELYNVEYQDIAAEYLEKWKSTYDNDTVLSGEMVVRV